MIRVAPYTKGDERSIAILFEHCFGKKLDPNLWNWRYLENPVGIAIIGLAWDGDSLISHYAVTPVKILINGCIETSGLSGATMTHPEYRGLKLFPKLAEIVYQRMLDSGMKMVWGFPNNKSHRGFVQNLGWRDVYEIPFMRREIAQTDTSSSPYDPEAKFTFTDEEIDAIWKSASTEIDVSVARTAEYIKWRYFDNPGTDYIVFGHKRGEALNGFAITKKYAHEIQIVDILELPASGAAVELVRQVIGFAANSGYRSVALWCNIHHSWHGDLEKLGFINDRPVTYLGARLLVDEPHLNKALDYSSWHVSMGDSDNF